ncbi:thiamine phosphate synthase [Pedobacter aquae]|uniref:Thiamine phosphate synthase n=1 Tax=Pedobacter aquae TaxID=2605747 RepID=A0A5C0VGP6_9SPHI|nr:thiamine phosphate synthase [Pedobacter aquae]QEK51239.1 thiamine phosphate synthase [Pedobacter aquae]
MELVVISNPVEVYDEVDLVKQLFNNGLTKFHFRKPKATLEQCKDFLNAFDKADLAKIALHQFHHLVKDFDIKHLHFKERDRHYSSSLELAQLKLEGFTLSTSIHDAKDIQTLAHFDYAFLGPVFNSISKIGYMAKSHDNWINALKRNDFPVFAVGGVEKANIQQLNALEFKGAAVLGAIWEAVNPVEEFKLLKSLCLQQDPMY